MLAPRRSLQEHAATEGAIETKAAIEALEREGYLVRKPAPLVAKTIDVDFARLQGDRVRIGVISDTHFGSIYQQPTLMTSFLRYARKKRVSAILHCGDVTDGPFRRHRNPHEVWLHTWASMRDYAATVLPKLGIPYYFVSGNHDDWFLEDGGPDVVESICEAREDFNYLGRTQGFLRFGKVLVELFHPNKGGAYALSYNTQKDIEQMAPEDKPHIYLAGNHHKALHLPGYRNVEGFLLPAYQSRSHWMQGKRLASVVGGVILEFGTDARGIAPSLSTEWVLERVPQANDFPGSHR